MEVVEQRNQIVDCLEMDRKREADEDRSVRERLQTFSGELNQLKAIKIFILTWKPPIFWFDRHLSYLSTCLADRQPKDIVSETPRTKGKKGKLRLLHKDKSKKSSIKKEDKEKKSKKSPAAAATAAEVKTTPKQEETEPQGGSGKKHSKKKWFS